MNSKKIKIARIATVPEAFVSLTKNFQDYLAAGHDIDLICSPGSYDQILTEKFKLNVIHCEIPRNISVLKDIMSVIHLTRIFIKNNYDIVHSNTPKAGLVSALAGFLSFRKIRLHTFTGQRWATTKNPLRFVLKFIDHLIIFLNTRCYADSSSQIQFLIDENVAKPDQILCLGQGSFGGIDTEKFNMNNKANAHIELRKKLNIPENSICCLYVGRIVKDKGLNEFIQAFKKIDSVPNLHLVLVGSSENESDPVDQISIDEINRNPKIHSLGFQTDVDFYMKACDFICLPSYREGFGSVIIEAAACGTAAIGTNIPGLKDAIIHNETGILITQKNVPELIDAILKMSTDLSFRKQLEQKSYERAVLYFNHRLISELQITDYNNLFD